MTYLPLPTRWVTTMLTALFLSLGSFSAQAEQSQDFGNHVVHFNAIPTGFLNPKVATQFNVRRSKNRALLNVSVLKKHMGTSGEPVSAQVTAKAVNLTGQAREINMREVRQGQAIYQLGDFKIHNEETLDFTIEATPVGGDQTYTVKFRRQFFVD